jgi:hypothetical protein
MKSDLTPCSAPAIHPLKAVQTAVTLLGFVALAATANGTEFHVATSGSDAAPGTKKAPFHTVQHAADLAQPGDVITVHAGIYRERVSPPRGGTSEQKRITYQAAPGEQVTITGSEPVKGWERVSGDTWKVTLPNAYFGKFNPFGEIIHGDWCGNPRGTSAGAVYLNGDWLLDAPNLAAVLAPAGKTPLWFATVEGLAAAAPEFLLNVASFQAGAVTVPANKLVTQSGTQLAPCAEGGQCVGFIRPGNWVRYAGVDFGAGATEVTFRAAAAPGTGGVIELHRDTAEGGLLGVCAVTVTGDWQKWETFTAKLSQPVSGVKNLCLVFKARVPAAKAAADSTVIYAQFPGVNPNEAKVEINVRQTVFTPVQTGVNYLTVRGFDLRDAATPWAPPSAGQFGVISAYWCKGWIIEDNEISYSKCCGVALGKYSDEFDNTNDRGSADPYTDCVRRALKNGWNQGTVGSHVVRNNRIHHCEQTGIVGSMGCAFSTVSGNEVHDVHLRGLFEGAEMAGIKFHGAIDVVIRSNHIYRCGNISGLWLDWMAQGAQVTGNLMHDNHSGYGDVFCEMQHGPILFANNLLLSPHRSFAFNAQGIAAVHNLVAGPVEIMRGDTRSTPYQPAHGTEIAGLYAAATGDSGDDRFYNNVFVAPGGLAALNRAVLPCFAAGNVFTKGTQASKFDTDPLLLPDFNPGLKLEQKADGWYLTITEDPAWRAAAKGPAVTTELLGQAKVPGCRFENRDGTPINIGTDYFGKPRDAAHPMPGPFEDPGAGEHQLKVWPVGG